MNLAMIGELVSHLPAHAVRSRQAYHVHEEIPGGDATVMLTPAAPGWEPGHSEPVTAELPNDVRPPLDVLAYWVNRWHAHTGTRPPDPMPDLDGAADYLARNLHRIAATVAFVRFAHDLAAVRNQLENLLHAGDRADTSRTPCWDCGTRLQKVWATDARRDHWRCPTCGQVYDQGRYERAQHDHLASRGADRFVALTDAVAVTGRPEQTIRAWARDGSVTSRRLAGGPIEVWWPHVRDRHRTTPTRRRT